MLEPFEYRGLWWLPEQPERSVAGVLKFSQDDAALELIGHLPREDLARDPASGEVQVSIGPESRDRILGLSTDGKRFTLDQCHSTGFNLAFPGIMTERFVPSLILEGHHYEPGELVVFDELLVRYTQLDAWVATSGFTSTPMPPNEHGKMAGIDLSFRLPPPVTVALQSATAQVTFSSTTNHTATEVSVTQLAAFRLRFQEPQPVEAALEFGYQLRNFVALGVGRPVTPLAISGFVLPPPDAEPDAFTGAPARKLKINLFYRLSHVPVVKELHPAQMLFSLADAGDRFGELLQSWFAKQEVLRPVFDLYFGAIYNRHAFLEQRFLSLMQAIETYHRRTSTETDLSPAEHARRLDEILQATPGQYRQWLARKLEYSNELVLRRRLDDVIKRCPQVVMRLIDKKRAFVHRVGTARNYFTHYNPELADEAPKGLDLYPLAMQLQALIEMCLLLELGFDCDEIDGLFSRVGRYEEARP